MSFPMSTSKLGTGLEVELKVPGFHVAACVGMSLMGTMALLARHGPLPPGT